MNAHEMPKDQLVQELETARLRIAELEAAHALHEAEYQQLVIAEHEQRALAEALCQTGTALTSTFRRDEVLDRILDEMSRVVTYDAACIILIEGEKGRVFRWRGYAKFSASNFVVSVIPNLAKIPVLQQIRQTHQALVVSQADPQDEWINQPGREWIKAYAVAPIISRGRVIGLLNVDRQAASFNGQADAQYLHAFADQAAIALENSWLYDRARYEIARRIRALNKERDFISAILDTIGALVIVLDPQGRIVRFNRAYETTVGFSTDEVKNRYFWELFLPEAETGPFKQLIEQLPTGKFPGQHKSHLKTRNGDLRQVVWTNTALRGNRGQIEYFISTGLDVTEHHKTTLALYANKKKYKSLTDQLPIGVYRATPTGELLQANPALATLFDFNSVKDLLRIPKLSAYGIRTSPAQYREQRVVQNEIKCRTITGKDIWIRNTGRAVFDEQGTIDYIGGTIEDITERKLAEEALRESERRFRHVMSSISDHIYVTETTGSGNLKTLYMSPHVEALTGYPLERFMADWRFWITIVVHPDDRVIAGTHQARAIMGRSSEVEYRLIRADRRVIWVRNSVRVETNKFSRIIYGVVSDITQRKQAEEALAAEQERLAVTLRSIADGVVAIDADRRIVLINPVGRAHLAALTNVDYGEIITHLGRYPLNDILKASTGANGLHEIQLDGPPNRIFEVAAQRMDTDHRVRGWVLIIRDVTEKRAFQDRTQQQERLAAVGQLAAGIAHDFNNILTTIIGLAELNSDSPDLPKLARRDMKRIAEQGQLAARLTRQILDFGRKSITAKRSLSLDSFVKEAVKLLKRTISEDITIALDISPDEHICNADPTQMQQLLTNLAINAQDAMPTGGTLTFTLSRLALQAGDEPPHPDLPPGDWLHLSISDTGVGIAPEHLPHLFEPFFTTKEIGKGTGLGLAQVYGIVKQHEGFIDVKSQLESGTTFTLYLPAAPVEKTVDNYPRQKGSIPAGHGEVILLVEDNATVLSVTQSMLERLNYRVIAAGNGRDALALFDQPQNKIDLVLTDITMPEMGGLALSKALRARNSRVKVIAMSGYPLKEETEDFFIQGFEAWLSKPLSIEKVAQVLNQVLSQNE